MTVAIIAIATSPCFFSTGVEARQLLQPSMKPTVVDLLQCGQTFSILKTAVAEAGLVDALTAPGADITVFAPTNKAFVAALDKLGLTTEELLASDSLADILKYHVMSGKIFSTDIAEGESAVATLLGPEITIINDDGGIKINDATVQYADLEAQNGVVHIIDEVLLPPEEDAPQPILG